MPRGRKPKIDANILRDDRFNYIDKELSKELKQNVYTTEIIDKLLKQYEDGDPDVDMRPFFHGDITLRNADLTFEYTEEEWAEKERCEDALYFIEHYCKFKTDTGRKIVKLRQYQKELCHILGDEHWDEELGMLVPDNRHVILMQSRQTGKTTTTVSFLVAYICTHSDKNIAIVANKGDTAEEIFEKMMDVLRGLPFFLRPGIKRQSDDRLKTDTNVSVRCYTSSKTAVTGLSGDVIILDEYAKMTPKMQNFIFASVFPAMNTSRNAQLIIMSTPDGKYNKYYNLWNDALNGKNTFKPFQVFYWQVPHQATPEWKEETIKNFGLKFFHQEYELSFDDTDSKIVPPTVLTFMDRIRKKFESVDIYGVPHSVSKKILWHPDFHPDQLTENDLLTRRFLLQIDTAQGKQTSNVEGELSVDWNVINIYEIELLSPCRIMKNRLGYKEVKSMDVIRFRQVGIYLDQEYNEEQCADAAKHIVFTVFKNGQGTSNGEMIDNCRIMLEINFNGVNWIKKFQKHDMYYTSLIIKTYHSQKAVQNGKKDLGFKTVGGQHGKGYWCENGAMMLQKHQIIISQDDEDPSQSSIQQLGAFGKNTKGSYGGDCMHDDIAVTVLFVSIAVEQDEFIDWIDDWFRQMEQYDLSEERMKLFRKVMALMNIYVEQEYDDEQFSKEDIEKLYGGSAAGFGKLSKTYDRFGQQNNNQTYNPYGAQQGGMYPGMRPGVGMGGFGQYSQGTRFNPGGNPFGGGSFRR